MSDHDLEGRSAARPLPREIATRAAERSAALDRSAPDPVSCRLGDASCASAHAAPLNRSRRSEPAAAQDALLRLQRQYGNRYVGRVLDRAADGPGGDGGLDAIERSIDQARGGGQGLDHRTRGQMESAFGADFGGVRVHTDARADELSQSISARAFATGHDVFFREGEYDPGSSRGRELLAHELTHVVQQTGGGIQRKMTVSQPDDPHEVEADRMAAAVMQREHARGSEDDKEIGARLDRQPEALAETDEEKKKKHGIGNP